MSKTPKPTKKVKKKKSYQSKLLSMIEEHLNIDNPDVKADERIRPPLVLMPEAVLHYCDYKGEGKDSNSDTSTALLLSKLIYWADKGRKTDGYIFKAYPEWRSETGLSRRQVMQATKRLKDAGLIETKLKKICGFPVKHFKVNRELLMTNLKLYLTDGVTMPPYVPPVKVEAEDETQEALFPNGKKACPNEKKAFPNEKNPFPKRENDNHRVLPLTSSKKTKKKTVPRSRNCPGGGDSLSDRRTKVKNSPPLRDAASPPLKDAKKFFKKRLHITTFDYRNEGQLNAVMNFCINEGFDFFEFCTWSIEHWSLLRTTLKDGKSRLKKNPSLLEINCEKEKGIGEAFKNRTIPKPKKIYTKDSIAELKRDHPNESAIIDLIKKGTLAKVEF